MIGDKIRSISAALVRRVLIAATFVIVGVQLAAAHPVPQSPLWLTIEGGSGPGRGKHIVLVAADRVDQDVDRQLWKDGASIPCHDGQRERL